MSDQASEAYQEMMARDGVKRMRERIVELEKGIGAERRATRKWLELFQDEQIKHKAAFTRAERAEFENAALREELAAVKEKKI